jgi:uncharacterized protein
VLRRLDMRTLDAPSGGASRIDAPVPVEPMVLGGQRYLADPDQPELRLDAVRAVNGWHLRLRGGVDVSGPCWRCVEDARVHVDLDATEVSIDGSDDPELTSLYMDAGVLDVASWARDAVVEALPAAILCRDDCAGLCPTCGTNLNEGSCDCVPPPPDSRWGALEDLARRMREAGGTGDA